jgi:hypothetical protein
VQSLPGFQKRLEIQITGHSLAAGLAFHNIHVDGAIGAVAILTQGVKSKLAEIDLADSVALDLHKWMHIPFEAGCVIVRSASVKRTNFLTPSPSAYPHGCRILRYFVKNLLQFE